MRLHLSGGLSESPWKRRQVSINSRKRSNVMGIARQDERSLRADSEGRRKDNAFLRESQARGVQWNQCTIEAQRRNAYRCGRKARADGKARLSMPHELKARDRVLSA
jgi:hypothetical protein